MGWRHRHSCSNEVCCFFCMGLPDREGSSMNSATSSSGCSVERAQYGEGFVARNAGLVNPTIASSLEFRGGPNTAAILNRDSIHETADESLVGSIAKGDKRALYTLYGRHDVRVYPFALRF